MILDIEPKRKKNGLLDEDALTISEYKPSDQETESINKVMADFQHGNILMNKTFHEFNDISVIERLNRDKLSFNTYLPDDGEQGDSVDSWKSNAIRPLERNRGLDIASQVSEKTIFPQVYAQNQQDEEDRKAASIMRYLMEWSGDQQDYDKTQLYGIITALYSPASIIHTEYTENLITKLNPKTGKREEIIDDETSGFRSTVVPVNELYIENMYQHDVQKQGFLIWRRVISYDVAASKYSDSKNFKHVKAQLQTKFEPSTQVYYDQQDDSMTENQVEEVIYWNRRKDIKLNLVNGILMTEHDAPNPRQDSKYPFVKTGYELFDEGKFFYYKSVVFKLQPDARNSNELWRMFIDAAYLNAFTPMIITGEEEVSSGVIAPGAVTTFANQDTQITPINTGSNNASTMNALQLLDNSMQDTSSAPPSAESKGTKTAFEVSTIQQNALTNLGMFAKMISFGVKDWGELMMSDILQYLTIGEVMNIAGDDSRLNFKKFLLPDQTIGNKRGTIKIEFDINTPENDKDMRVEQEKLMEREGGLDNDTRIFIVNPTKFRDMKFFTKVEPELVVRQNKVQIQQDAERMYTLLIQNPRSNQEEVLRMLLDSNTLTTEDPDKFIAEEQEQVEEEVPANTG